MPTLTMTQTRTLNGLTIIFYNFDHNRILVLIPVSP